MNKQVVVKNLLISYFQTESQQGNKTLLFLHGWRSEARVWQSVIKDLGFKIKDLNLYALDLPGFGGSQVSSSPMTVSDYAEVVGEFINKLDLKNIVVIGHSFGGRVGIKLASKYPSAIEKLVLVDSAGFAMAADKKNAMNIAAKIAKPFFKPKFMQGLRKKIYKQIGAEDYVATPGVMTQIYLNSINEDLTEDMKKIAVPTLIIYGDQDTATPPSFGEKMHSLIQNSTFKILAAAGHFSFLDKPEEFVKELLSFLK